MVKRGTSATQAAIRWNYVQNVTSGTIEVTQNSAGTTNEN
jgi:hypothetical protein